MSDDQLINSHGPAPAPPLSPELAASLGLTPNPGATAPTLVPANQVKPEDVGTLSIEYRDGQPVIVVSGGAYVPAGLPVVNASGNRGVHYVLATYPALEDVDFIYSPNVDATGAFMWVG